MEPLTKRHRLRSPGFIIDYVLQLCLVVGLACLTVLFWPDDMLRTPISMIPLGDWIWALVAAIVAGLTSLVAYCVVKETAVLLFMTASHQSSIPRESAVPEECEPHSQN